MNATPQAATAAQHGHRWGLHLAAWALALSGAAAGLAPANAEPESEPAPAADALLPMGKPVPSRHAGTAIEKRVQLLTRELRLDPAQQLRLKAVLKTQREQVARVWSDESLAAPLRVGSTQAISQHTAEQIRALLNPEQRKKYNPPRSQEVADLPRPNVEEWMGTTQQAD